MDELIVTIANMKLVKHEGAYYIIYAADTEARPMTFAISDEDAKAIMEDNDAIYDIIVKYHGKQLCCEVWSLRYNH